MGKVFVGIDVGSVSVNLAVLNNGRDVLKHRYARIEGEPLRRVHEVLKDEGYYATFSTIRRDIRFIRKIWNISATDDLSSKRQLSVQKRLKYQRKAFNQGRMMDCNTIQNDIDKIEGVTPEEAPQIVKLIHMTEEQLDNEIKLMEEKKRKALTEK